MSDIGVVVDLIVFDFDGTICQSVDVKTDAFYQLYLDECGEQFAARVRDYHLANVGISRYDKIRYCEEVMLGRPCTAERMNEMARRFGEIVRDRVIESAMVPGVAGFIEAHRDVVLMMVASGTPTDELRQIVEARGMHTWFDDVQGSPMPKGEIIGRYLRDQGILPHRAVMVGDQISDIKAARFAGVHFVGYRPPGEDRLFDEDATVIKHFDGLSDAIWSLANSGGDAAVAPYETATRNWPTPYAGSTPILLLPSAVNHVDEIMPLYGALINRGYEAVVAVGDRHWPAVAAELGRYDLTVLNLVGVTEAISRLRAIVSMSPADHDGEVVSMAAAAGVTVFAKVEGAKDYAGGDISNTLNSFRVVDHVLCQGRNDFDGLDGSRFIVGSSRLERIARGPIRPAVADHIVINADFAHGDVRDQLVPWVETAVAACETLHVPYTVAVDPETRQIDSISHASTLTASRLLPAASTLISRFSTVPFEAMARGVPFVYHNPHGEKVSTFAHGGDAFRTTATRGRVGRGASRKLAAGGATIGAAAPVLLRDRWISTRRCVRRIGPPT